MNGNITFTSPFGGEVISGYSVTKILVMNKGSLFRPYELPEENFSIHFPLQVERWILLAAGILRNLFYVFILYRE
jgi:hypothetical protein